MYDPLRRMIRPALAIAILHMATASALAVPGVSPQIESLSTQSIDRSGRLLIFGANFGATQGKSRVLIDGRVAIATTWTDTEIHAYVPEAASTASVPVTVLTARGSSNTTPINVTMRRRPIPILSRRASRYTTAICGHAGRIHLSRIWNPRRLARC